MVLLALVSLILLALAAVGGVCDLWRLEDPLYPTAAPAFRSVPEPLVVPAYQPVPRRREWPSTAA